MIAGSKLRRAAVAVGALTGLAACAPAPPPKPKALPVVQVTPVPVVTMLRSDPTLTGTPHLRIELGMHTSTINDADADSRGRFLASASDDKTVRIWSLADGTLLRTLRLPIDGVDGGKAYTVAMSPDGKQVATGGYTDALFIYDRSSGKLVQRLDEMPNSIKSLAYSPRGDTLVVGLASGGIRILKTGTQYAEHSRDNNYGASVYGLAFDSKGRLATAAEDHIVRLYNTEYARIATRQLDDDIFRLAFSNDDTKLALGAYDGPRVTVVSATDLTTLASHDLKQYDDGNLADVEWLGDRLIAGGEFDLRGDNPVVAFNDPPAAPSFWLGGTDSVGALVPLPNGQLATVMTDPRVLLFDNQGNKLWSRAPSKLDMRSVPMALSPDGLSVKLLSYPRDPAPPAGVSLQIAGIHADNKHTLPLTEAPGMDIAGWKNTGAPSFNGTRLALQRNETSRCLAISADHARFALGTEWHVQMYDKGGQLLWTTATPSVTWAINLSADGRLLVAAVDDGTLLWYRTDDGTLLLSHFRTREGKWITWTPEGFFDASAGGDALVGYHFNRGGAGTPEFVSAKQLRTPFFRPDLMAPSLSDDRSAIDAAVAEHGDIGTLVGGSDPNRRRVPPPPASRLKPGDPDVH